MDPMFYLVRLAQFHPSFRKPELEALALMAGMDVKFVEYSESVCLLDFCLPSKAMIPAN